MPRAVHMEAYALDEGIAEEHRACGVVSGLELGQGSGVSLHQGQNSGNLPASFAGLIQRDAHLPGIS